jgi:hypothetical protein
VRRALVGTAVSALAAIGFATAGQAESRKQPLESYCSPTGDYCVAITDRRGRIKFELSTFSFKGRYRICVKNPGGKECHRYKLHRDGDTWSDRVDWARNFEVEVPARYTVVWRFGGQRLGALPLKVGGPTTGSGERRDYWRKCGTRVIGEALLVTTKSHAVRCRLARRIAAEYAQGDRRPIGFHCSEPEPSRSGETQRGVCRREGGRVKVVFGI